MDTGQKVKHLNSICGWWILRSKRTGCQFIHVPPGHKFNYSKHQKWAKQNPFKPLPHLFHARHSIIWAKWCAHTHTQSFHWQQFVKEAQNIHTQTDTHNQAHAHKSWQNIWPTSFSFFFCVFSVQIFKHGKDDDEVISKNKQNVSTVSKNHKVKK